MLTINSSIDYPDIDEYSAALNRDGYICLDIEGFSAEAYYKKANLLTEKTLAVDIMSRESGGAFRSLDRNSILGYLMRVWGVSESNLTNRKTRALSLDRKLIIGPLLNRNIATEFFEHYNAEQSQKALAGKMVTIAQAAVEPAGESNDGRRLTKLPFSATLQKNMRFNYNNFDIISQVPKEAAHFICAPKGYCLVWGDFAQSDFRVAYNLLLRSPENDKLMSACDDKYEALARMVYKSQGKEFDIDEFKKKRPLFKRLTLATMYGTRGSYNSEENDFIQEMTKFLRSCEKYAEFERRLKDLIDAGVTVTINSYFDYEQIAPKLYRAVDTLNNCLNMPLQTGTSEIVIMSVQKILQRLRDKGLSEDDARIYMVRHDEPIFLVKLDAFERAMGVFRESADIQVDDWTPLRLDFTAGYSYKIPDDELCAKMESYEPQSNSGAIECTRKDWLPVEDIRTIAIDSIGLKDGRIAIAYGDIACKNISSFVCDVPTDENGTPCSAHDIFIGGVLTDEVVKSLVSKGITYLRLMVPYGNDNINYKGLRVLIRPAGYLPPQFKASCKIAQHMFYSGQGLEDEMQVTENDASLVKGVSAYEFG